MPAPISEAVQAAKQRRHLDRLETLLDSIYALVIVFLVAQFPNPLGFEEQFSSFWHFIRSEGGDLVPPLIGVLLVVIYWLQNNLLFGYLERTDNKHATLAIVQLFFVLFYLYSADLLPYLGPLCDLRVVRVPGQEVSDELLQRWSPVDAVELGAGGRTPIYHMGNNRHHEAVLELALATPGIVVLHDLMLHHLLIESTLGKEEEIGRAHV